MARYLDVHPHDPQPRSIRQTVETLRSGGLIAYPTDSGYALGAALGNQEAKDRIRDLRRLDDKHHYPLVCRVFAQLGQFVLLDNDAFRAIKGVTPGPYTFILKGTREVPRRLLHPKKKTVGVRIPDNRVVQALLAELGEPMLSSTLILPGESEPMTEGWLVKEELDHQVDVVLDSGECGSEPTTVIDYSEDLPVVVRIGAGDPGRTVTEADNVLFTTLTMNTQPLHLDAAESESQPPFHARLVNSMFTLSTLVGLSVAQLTQGTIVANLGFSAIAFPKPVFHGDTLYAETLVADKRASSSRPGEGIVTLAHTARNQHGEVVATATRQTLVPPRARTRGRARRGGGRDVCSDRRAGLALLPGGSSGAVCQGAGALGPGAAGSRRCGRTLGQSRGPRLRAPLGPRLVTNDRADQRRRHR